MWKNISLWERGRQRLDEIFLGFFASSQPTLSGLAPCAQASNCVLGWGVVLCIIGVSEEIMLMIIPAILVKLQPVGW